MTLRIAVIPTATVGLIAMLSAGCASDARVAEDERRIVELQQHVVALEALLSDDDETDDDNDAKLVSALRGTGVSPVMASSPRNAAALRR